MSYVAHKIKVVSYPDLLIAMTPNNDYTSQNQVALEQHLSSKVKCTPPKRDADKKRLT